MGFDRPQLLLLLLLVPLVWRFLSVRGRVVLTVLRCLVAALVVVCLAGPRLDLTEPGIDLIVVVDRSLSVGEEGRDSEAELLRLLGSASTRGEHDRISVVSFGSRPLVEARASKGPVSPRFDRDPGENGSDLAEALLLAARARSPERRAVILVLSDGLYTGEDPLRTEVLSEIGDVPVWYRRVGRAGAADVVALGITLPADVPEKAGFIVRYSILGPAGTDVDYVLRSGETVLASGTRKLRAGPNHFFARDIADRPGTLEYTLEVSSAGDTVEENNVASALLSVSSAPRALIASSSPGQGLIARALLEAGIPVDAVDAGAMDWSAARLAPYRLVILENLPLESMGHDGARATADAVESGVSALLVTGGVASFGQGGYHKSPLDPLLPVTMELRDDQIRGVMALVAVLDRSGSMSMDAGKGKTKMDLANIGVAEAIRLLSPHDQVSVIAVDSSPHVIVPLSQADDTSKLIKAVLGIESMGGGIFVRTALGAASDEIRKSKLPTRHILLFSDSADSEEQLDSVAFVRELSKQDIGVSVIGLGTPADPDAAFLKSLAKAGGGEVYFTDRAAELPRIFSQEVIRVAERGFVVEPTPVTLLPDLVRLQLSLDLPPFTLGGFNLSSLRKGASAAVMTENESKAPIVAFWRKGRASVGTFTAEVDGPHSGTFPSWQNSQELLVNLSRLLASSISTSDAKAWSRLDRSMAEVRIEVDAETALSSRTSPLSLRLLSPPGTEPIDVPLVWDGPTTAVARTSLSSPGHYLPVLDLGDGGLLRAPPLTLPYSPEFLPTHELSGEEILASLARATDGRDLTSVEEVFETDETSEATAWLDVSPWLALAILILLLLEIAEKRLALSELIPRRSR
ncbi:MAG: VWA domain-containing protein [Deltaproteobacteria bacterium]|nr:VWA domain-containing protein [Deltaproteobacteria bacterium]